VGDLTDLTIKCEREWVLGDRIGGGGFGEVYEARAADGTLAAVKLVPAVSGADRELLFTSLQDVPNVVPIIESGEYEGFHVLVMPRADGSLRDRLEEAGALETSEVITVLTDIGDALAALATRTDAVVHRDLKPENVLLLQGHWCLADFGIARYADATTAPNTHKFAGSYPYMAPERWRLERATSATDVYALGVIAYELIPGTPPFPGPQEEDYREQHLYSDPPRLEQVPAALGTLIDECLFKANETRPFPANLRARLSRIAQPPASPGLARLREVNRAEVGRRAAAARESSVARSAKERRDAMFKGALRSFVGVSNTLLEAIRENAPATQVSAGALGWTAQLGGAKLTMEGVVMASSPSGSIAPFEVIGHTTLYLEIPQDRHGYRGRGHALWFGDVQQPRDFGWFETAFMRHPLTRMVSAQNPFALRPDDRALRAVGPGMMEFQVAWPFTRLNVGELDEFVGRWGEWFAIAAEGRLGHPGSMPERQPVGSWRTN
jgi:serine/threonine protein kinase